MLFKNIYSIVSKKYMESIYLNYADNYNIFFRNIIFVALLQVSCQISRHNCYKTLDKKQQSESKINN